jgi:hypothetical protein
VARRLPDRQAKRRGLARLDDAILGRPGTRRGWFGDLVLGLHPWWRYLWGAYALIAVAEIAWAAAVGSSGHLHQGIKVLAGAIVWFIVFGPVARGKAVRPPKQ